MWRSAKHPQQVEASARLDGLVGQFASAIQKLDTNGGMVAQGEVRKGPIVASMEYYCFNDPANATSFLGTSGNGIHFILRHHVPKIGLKSPRLLVAGVEPYLTTEEWSEIGHRLETQDAWHVQTRTGGLLWSANTAAYDAAIGGAQTDGLDGGVCDDTLIGDAGVDFLTGGTGRDTLIGGVDSLMEGIGTDICHFATGWAATPYRTATEKASSRSMGWQHHPITSADTKKTGASTWRTDEKRISYVLVDEATIRCLIKGEQDLR